MNKDIANIITTAKIIKTPNRHERLKLNGNVSYDQDQVYRFSPILDGVIQKVNFRLGDFVRKGQTLLEIRSAELNEMSANMREAQLHLKTAQRQLSATQNLYADGVASDREILEAQVAVSNAESEIQKINEVLYLYSGDIEKGVLTIKAKSDGYIVEKHVVEGQQVESSNDPLFILGNLSKVWVQANVYSGYIGRIKTGQSAAIETTAYPGKVFEGKINRISNVIDPRERVLKAIIELDNSSLLLKPEMMVTVDVYLDNRSDALAIPHESVVFDADAYHLIKYVSDCEMKIVEFVPIYEDNDFFYMASNQLRDGDEIVKTNSLLVYNKLIGK
ncbi:efflux RND transporter periplasmic adaptor subunit [Olivibacter sp. SDN3]|uniref:efflux RND transporter periplasmic adaptor subunit n=1 Tax=Olivibacter sp. SDN3 TaxID=2764720 RepID=UPI001651661C|nr:efflux RND transporter periplasmic adaptor subunit [Olivibacter sp. SDN3]QNL49486.1 efflux RND transporter periplasmic adaptor subunit [Olivibacter sp. SDN3]